jgi:hypothetical protein
VLEIGARAGATGLPEIVRLHTGLDLYEVALRLALGEAPAIQVAPGQAAAVLVLRARTGGTLTRCRVPARVRSAVGLVSVRFDYAEGATVRPFRTGPDRIGDVVTTAETAAAAERRCAELAEQLEIAVTEPSSVC